MFVKRYKITSIIGDGSILIELLISLLVFLEFKRERERERERERREEREREKRSLVFNTQRCCVAYP